LLQRRSGFRHRRSMSAKGDEQPIEMIVCASFIAKFSLPDGVGRRVWSHMCRANSSRGCY